LARIANSWCRRWICGNSGRSAQRVSRSSSSTTLPSSGIGATAFRPGCRSGARANASPPRRTWTG
jgi:hypothetical protein